MKTFIFSSRDSKAEAFMQPFFAPHAGVATRGFIDAINDNQQGSDISKHPEDFELYQLGEFDNSSGLITPLEKPLLLLTGLNAVTKS